MCIHEVLQKSNDKKFPWLRKGLLNIEKFTLDKNYLNIN